MVVAVQQAVQVDRVAVVLVLIQVLLLTEQLTLAAAAVVFTLPTQGVTVGLELLFCQYRQPATQVQLLEPLLLQLAAPIQY